ncbi:MAG: ribonucleotide reductase N-terminal alpha domain-containing protein, partial [Clostridium sp.]
MKIQKRDGQLQEFEGEKIAQAIRKAFRSTNTEIEEAVLQEIIADITEAAISNEQLLSVEVVQDLVEEELMQHQYYKEAKSYILYRQKRNESRQVLHDLVQAVQQEELGTVLADIQQTYREEVYDLRNLLMKFHSFLKEDMRRDERLRMLIKASVELISKEAPKWEYIASRFLSYELHEEISARMQKLELSRFSNKLKYLEEQGYYGDYIRKAYSDAEIDELGAYLKDERDALFTYSGLELVKKRYLMCSHSHEVLETPQEMFMGIAMHLAMPEKERVYWAKQIYDILSQLQVTMATPTMSNARKPYHQLSSCFIDTVEDTLNNIYKSIDNFAQVSKYGGGMGLYFGKVRANGSDIRGFEGAAGGVIRWIKLVNDTATAVDQLGVRQGAVAVYLDAWHKDLPEFLNLRTNNGDDRMKAHDVFPAVCYPDLFW